MGAVGPPASAAAAGATQLTCSAAPPTRAPTHLVAQVPARRQHRKARRGGSQALGDPGRAGRRDREGRAGARLQPWLEPWVAQGQAAAHLLTTPGGTRRSCSPVATSTGRPASTTVPSSCARSREWMWLRARATCAPAVAAAADQPEAHARLGTTGCAATQHAACTHLHQRSVPALHMQRAAVERQQGGREAVRVRPRTPVGHLRRGGGQAGCCCSCSAQQGRAHDSRNASKAVGLLAAGSHPARRA